jgi:hypothetical protein
MNTLTNFLKAIDYKITDSSEYNWHCYGSDIRSIDSYNLGITECTALFTKSEGEIRELTMHDYENDRSYRWTDPKFEQARKDEALSIGADDSLAYDGVNFIELEMVEDMFEKMEAVTKGEKYDTRITIPVDLTEQEFLEVARAAHALDITINAFFEMAIKEAVCLA